MKLHDIILEAQRRIAAGDTADYADPFQRIDAQHPLLTCARAKCGKQFRQHRKHQIYCDVSCQVGAWNDKQAEKNRRLREAAKAEQAASRSVQEMDTTAPRPEQKVEFR